MKKILALFVALFLASLAFAGPASATDEKVKVDGKKQDICHATGVDGKFVSQNVTVESILQNNGHAYHQDGRDIIPAFTYYELVDHEWVERNFDGQGDTTLLAFDNCAKPVEPKKVQPAVTVVDECGTKNDSVTLVQNEGYTGNVTKNGLTYTVNVTANEGFTLVVPDNTWTVSDEGMNASKTVTLTAEDCDLPETGGEATYNTVLGGAALAGVILLTGAMVLTRKRS